MQHDNSRDKQIRCIIIAVLLCLATNQNHQFCDTKLFLDDTNMPYPCNICLKCRLCRPMNMAMADRGDRRHADYSSHNHAKFTINILFHAMKTFDDPVTDNRTLEDYPWPNATPYH